MTETSYEDGAWLNVFTMNWQTHQAFLVLLPVCKDEGHFNKGIMMVNCKYVKCVHYSSVFCCMNISKHFLTLHEQANPLVYRFLVFIPKQLKHA